MGYEPYWPIGHRTTRKGRFARILSRKYGYPTDSRVEILKIRGPRINKKRVAIVDVWPLSPPTYGRRKLIVVNGRKVRCPTETFE